ncbi:hypothetical protein [Hymenobacter volaticus]|uniref:hypothetical protein n=1 Tax=Hymenobacter volaticus TaxID=2932254 RepID=UPI0028809AD0|nr:hypothetical protein [Hymenobacter volaticus]
MALKKALLLLVSIGLLEQAHAQTPAPPTFTRADTLRGALTPLRTCYDLHYYHLDVKLDPARKFISGSNLFGFTATQDFTRLQFDLFANLAVDKVLYHGQSVPFTREVNAVFVTFPQPIKQGTQDSFTVQYSGSPTEAKRAPWDGGWCTPRTSKANRGWPRPARSWERASGGPPKTTRLTKSTAC